MKTFTLSLPDSFEMGSFELKMTLASKLYEDGKLSLAQAAQLVDLSKSAFMEILKDYAVSVINHPAEDLENDLENARKHNI
jgi:predicted HTH domain antitoxin